MIGNKHLLGISGAQVAIGGGTLSSNTHGCDASARVPYPLICLPEVSATVVSLGTRDLCAIGIPSNLDLSIFSGPLSLEGIDLGRAKPKQLPLRRKPET
jgi:hypothetical protein